MPPAPTQRRLSTVSRHLQASPSASPSSFMAYRSPVTSHVLDTARGCPAADMRVELQVLDHGDAWRTVNAGKTNADGRVETPLVPEGARFETGTYRVVFATREYFEAAGVREFFYPRVEVAFVVKDPTQHFHVPLLINPFGYSTYRGS